MNLSKRNKNKINVKQIAIGDNNIQSTSTLIIGVEQPKLNTREDYLKFRAQQRNRFDNFIKKRNKKKKDLV